jgi:penicillin-binding protein 1A
VVQHGTGIKVAAVGKPLAGKTGTSSEWFDAWFVGFSPDIAAGAYVGFDTPRTLGNGETGGNVAAPIFRDFMAEALKNAPALPFPDPPNADMVLVNAITGQPTVSGDKDAVLEAFRPGTGPGSGYGNPSTVPSTTDTVVSASDGLPPGTIVPPPPPQRLLTGTGGLY